ncbi:DUF2950 domain-containing protein [Cupriavidus sp. WKF15]|uniref:DUF2950 domain-containing protein n=1 Tax=Cupriavidus sp. WKF15 TaxID=3032282 RepID=UPI0023E28B64|nr:DUF2950 domain-containing protein [Cupriavidus sp. WKF15]WER50588.1 DUF2950 domain-containing protein [Cupriavidus sp. WKF15]
MAYYAAAALLLGLGSVAAAHANQVFATPEAAMTAFGDAVLNDDEAAMKRLLGANYRDLIPPVGADVRYQFLAAWGKSHTVKQTDRRAEIAVGDDGWTLPIPLEKSGSGKGWQFDTRAGAEEMRVRRIGRNELAVIQTMLAIHDAQNEYAQTPHDGSHMLAYASKLSSAPGRHDGLYWPTRPGEPESPLGPGFNGAGTRHASKDGYYGYHYKLLTSQGPHAPGGAFDYLLNGKLFGGFAVIAWPVRYQDTGVMSFMVSHDGQVYERDLGANGAAKAEATKSFDPDQGWRKVAP